MKGGPEGEQRSGAAAGVRRAFAGSAAHDDLDGRGFSPTDVFAESFGGSGGADFSSASSYFKVLGAFFCNFQRSKQVSASSPRNESPAISICYIESAKSCNFATLSFLVVSRSRARLAARPCTISCGFEVSEPIPFPGADSIFSSRCGAISGRLRFCRQRRNASVQKIDDRLGHLRQGGDDTRTNIEPRRNFGKKFVERLGSYQEL